MARQPDGLLAKQIKKLTDLLDQSNPDRIAVIQKWDAARNLAGSWNAMQDMLARIKCRQGGNCWDRLNRILHPVTPAGKANAA